MSFTWELVVTFDPNISEIQQLTVDILSGSVEDSLVPKEKAEYLKTKIPSDGEKEIKSEVQNTETEETERKDDPIVQTESPSQEQ